MPATDLSAIEIVKNFSSPYLQKRYKRDGITETNAYKLSRAISTGFLAETGQAVDDLEPQRFDYTAEQGFLDNRAAFWNVPRTVGEVDAALRLRIGQQKLIRWGVMNSDEMLTLLATLLSTTVDEIDFEEEIDEAGDREPAVIRFNIAPGIFAAAGITDIPTAITGLEETLDQVAAAGVRVYIATAGSAQYDVGDLFDDGETYS